MSNLRKINSSGDARATNKNDMELALSSIRAKLKFALDNPKGIIKESKNKKNDKGVPIHLAAARNFQSMLDRNESFTPNQISYIDGLYELTFKGLGLPSVGRRHDFTKKW